MIPDAISCLPCLMDLLETKFSQNKILILKLKIELIWEGFTIINQTTNI